MEKNCQNVDSDSKYLLEQLVTARKEINNLRQQIKSLRYVHERDVHSIKRLLGLCTSGLASFPDENVLSDAQTNTLSSDNEASTSNSISNYNLNCRPIGTISTWFPNKRGTPRQPTVCGKAPGKLTLFKSVFTNPEHALQGLEEFSHMWILFHFHKNELGHVRAKVAPPRLNGFRTGVFSTRSPHRPCPIGLSLVKIIKIEDYTIYFEGVDMVDQTPVLDIKPYIPQYDNPLHIENMLQTVNCVEEIQENNSVLLVNTSMNSVESWIANYTDEACNNSHDTAHVQNQRSVNSTNNLTSEYENLAQLPSSLLVDISTDEELALRLQAEEFQEDLHYDRELAEIIADQANLNSAEYDAVNSDIVNNDELYPRNSRLLDGADGPSAVCGTDLDSISRRALNLRLNDSSSSSSPIRMEVREAPDGEEGFDLSQSSNNQTSFMTSNSIINNTSNSQVVTNRQTNENISEEAIRIPDWIASSSKLLSVVFSDRAIMQLHEILNDKAEEKRQAVENVLKEDPRSVYLRQRYGNQFFTFLIQDLHITCKFDDERKVVTVFQVKHAGRLCDCGQPEWQCSGHSPSPVFNHDQ